MTPDRFAAALETLGWTQRHLARLLRCDTNMPGRWAKGAAAIPPTIAAWLERLVGAHQGNPAPEDWRARAQATTPASRC